MVSCNFAGRIGNNMFQIATTYAYARKNGLTPVFNNHDIFNWLPRKTDDMLFSNTYTEPSHEYTEIPKFKSGVILDGYFHSEKYFEDIRDYLLDEVFKTPQKSYLDTVAVHFRRGDYLDYPSKHPIPDFENYYLKAMEIFTSRYCFVIFSDDMEWAREKLKNSKHKLLYSDNFHYKNDYKVLITMARCQHFIISNSSYSWWGAWLSRNTNKRIISPTKEQWFGIDNKHLSTKDLIPDYFEQLSY